MATKRPDYTWENGFQQPAKNNAEAPSLNGDITAQNEDSDAYVAPPSTELVTSTAHNDRGVNVIRSWPTLYDGTNNPHGVPSWWEPKEEVDVLICGAGPSGLGLAVSLARQGVSFRIIDKADGPLACGRADGVQPRFLETVAKWGLADEVAEEGPLIEATAMYKDGERLLFTRSHQSDSRYRGLHVITQGQIERIYIRDLLRHKAIVERNCSLKSFTVDEGDDGEGAQDSEARPVHATVLNDKTGKEEIIRAKFLVGSDGGTSVVRKGLGIPFDGVSTDIYWGIMDCVFASDYPHAWVFGMVISSDHGCCAIIPREDGYIRLYTQLDVSHTGPLSASRQAKDATFAESGGKVEIHSITPEEVLEQANKIFAPYSLKFASSLSWFAIWKISERVARTYSSRDMRVHLAGDAAHIHSVLGAFGLNASILDVANLSWKLGLAAKGFAKTKELLSTYTSERRKHAVKIIKVSGEYLRFICGSALAVPDLDDPNSLDRADAQANGDKQLNGLEKKQEQSLNGDDPKSRKTRDLEFVGKFFKANGPFLLGVDCPYDESVIAPPSALNSDFAPDQVPAVRVRNGVRAPNPRVCLYPNKTGYLYDTLVGTDLFHLVVFASSLQGSEVRRQIRVFTDNLRSPDSFYTRFGGPNRFQVVLVVKLLPFEFGAVAADLFERIENLTVVYDERPPDEDAHTTWGASHKTGGIAVIRPDLWVGMTCFPVEVDSLGEYFGRFLKA